MQPTPIWGQLRAVAKKPDERCQRITVDGVSAKVCRTKRAGRSVILLKDVEKRTAGIRKKAQEIACKAGLPVAVDPKLATFMGKLPKRQVNKETVLVEACPTRTGGKTIVHVNQHNIKSNATKGTNKKVLTVKKGKTNTYGNQVVIQGQDGKEAARVVYSPDKPLSCGARVWIETQGQVKPLAKKG